MLDPTKKIPQTQRQRRRPNKMVGGVKSLLESNPISTRDPQKAQTKPYVQQDPEAPQRLSQTYFGVFECLLWSHRSAVACQGDRRSGCSRPVSCSITHHRAAEQMTHKQQNYYTKEILALLRKF